MADLFEGDAAYAIRLGKQAFTFSAAHFITYAGDTCEPLHGHNYRVAIEAEAPLDANHYVLDFIATRDTLAGIVRRLDHRMLLPTEHRTIRVQKSVGPTGGHEVVVTHGDRRWVFPAEDCVLLPVPNTTAEKLAEWIGKTLLQALEQNDAPRPARLTVEVDECEGQIGRCRLG
ncbi:6-pyruvoyl tetrahydropterin synthase family protein [Botrimarina sp.]|uniref:6-pyruvoyl trahydropterin synthase family protein n=1 Tax=Botrimarina sp. TaxID=2795802 RepID=UPI0032EB029F